MQEFTPYGFKWGPLRVERAMSLPEGRVVLTVKTEYRELNIYATPGGRSLRVFEKSKELRRP